MKTLVLFDSGNIPFSTRNSPASGDEDAKLIQILCYLLPLLICYHCWHLRINVTKGINLLLCCK